MNTTLSAKISVFLMFSLSVIFQRKLRIANDSDFGRRFGWFIESDGEWIGSLDYLRWDSHGQFWHEYRGSWCGPERVIIGSNAWDSNSILRNRCYTDVVIDSFSVCERPDGVLAIRGAQVPAERIRHKRPPD